MVKSKRIFWWTLVVIIISGMNISSVCKHETPLNTNTDLLSNKPNEATTQSVIREEVSMAFFPLPPERIRVPSTSNNSNLGV